jgi:hypothetical protein
MQKIMTTSAKFALVAGLALSVGFGASTVEAKTCFKKAGQGTAGSLSGAKFQVDEVLLQATDWSAWAEWMATGKTSGYDFGKRKYRCKKGGLGYECYGTSTICKK